MRIFLSFFLFLFLLPTVFALDFYGKVVEDNLSGSIPLSDATVIIVELDNIELSDTDGNFVFRDIRSGMYTVKIITLKGLEYDYTIKIDEISTKEDDPFLFIINTVDESIEEEIIITAERNIQIEPNIEEYGAELINNISVVYNDSFNIIVTEAGIFVNEREVGTPFLNDPKNGSFFSYGSLFSVFGGDVSWNRSYIDFFPIPTNTHLSDNTKPIISKESISRVKTIKGVPPGPYGQSLGGTTIVYPEEVKSNRLDIGLDLTDPFLSYRTKINDNTSLFTIARQSISQYTLFPIIDLIAEASGEVSFNIERYLYGDILLSLEYTKDIDRVKLLALAYYDTIDVESSDSFIELTSNNFPYFFGGGLQWSKLLGFNILNEIDIYNYYYVTNIQSELKKKDVGDTRRKIIELDDNIYNVGYSYRGNSTIWKGGIKNIYSQVFFNNHVLNVGSSLDYTTLHANYEDTFYYIDPNDVQTKKYKESSLAKYTLNEKYLKLYVFSQYDYEQSYNRGKTSFSISPGLSWIVQNPNKIYPSIRGDYSVTFSDIHTVSFSSGWSPAFLEELQYINKKVLEKTIKYPEKQSSFVNPNYGIMSFMKYLISPGNHQISVFPYFSWYYDFEGLFSQYRYNVSVDFSDPNYLDGNLRGFSYLPVQYGYGTGLTLRYKYTTDLHGLDISYTLGFVYFKTKEDVWLPASNDYRHTIKLSYLYKIHPAFIISFTNGYIIGTPFTPTVYKKNVITQYNLSPKTGVNTKQINSARSYMPTWTLVPALSGKFIDNKNVSLGYRFSLGDLLAWFQLTDREVKDKETAGSSNKDPSNRKIEFKFSLARWISQLEINVFLTIKL